MSALHKKIDRSIEMLKEEIRANELAYEEYRESRNFRDEQRQASRLGLKINLGLHKGKSLLLIPSSSSDTGRRNIRSNQNSTGVNLISKRTGNNVTNILPKKDYEVEATIENRGDIRMPAVNVEFFVSEKAQPHDVEFTCKKISVNFLGLQIEGRLKRGRLTIGDIVDMQGEDCTYMTRVNGIVKKSNSSTTFHTAEARDGEIRLFLTLNKPMRNQFKRDIKTGDLLVNSNRIASDNRSFRMRVRDVFSITGRGVVITGKVEQGTHDFRKKTRINVFTGMQNGTTRNQLGLPVSSARVGRFVPRLVRTGQRIGIMIKKTRKPIRRGDIIETTRKSFKVKRFVHSDSKDVKDQEHIGSITTHLGAFDSKIVSLPWKAPAEKNRRDYIFTARTYSIAPYDMPKNFDNLDPNTERHVGTKKIGWHRS